jgi:hypothetical protein
MDWPDYIRDQAAMYRKLAEQADDPVIKTELLELASVCDEVANNIEDHMTSGWLALSMGRYLFWSAWMRDLAPVYHWDFGALNR